MIALNHEKVISALTSLGDFFRQPDAGWQELSVRVQNRNPWFTPEQVNRATAGLAAMLRGPDIRTWVEGIRITDKPRQVGMILAGNIPMVGLHDLLCVLATGHHAQVKLSSSDDLLLPYVVNQLISAEPAFAGRVQYVERLQGFDAVIATGSNNSSRYFDYYFGKVPNIIRKNRNSVALLTGHESDAELAALGDDIFAYFGLGCRSVSKLLVPEGYDFGAFFRAIEIHQPIINHFKYNNNYDYNKSIYLVNLVPHLDNGFLLVKEDEALASPLAVLYYSHYQQADDAVSQLQQAQENIQCIVTAEQQGALPVIPFGRSQQPRLWDYADNIDTTAFLAGL
ncbi:acyl-CoA reductase [Pedobacter yulinensis]|uniref:Acyl-CoA reductase n=1 Tax=Pedobacter yulinensis TaxID=2126353 RepID=A0A2T3HH66_9SPHI|nr:acyl-CoA reductase [Pedobacter yulinensis]PST81779.1 acyl-CoA reductase [Pedobacter yulinensis]